MIDKHGDAPDMLDDLDLELITDYLTGQLSEERVAGVARRLEQDEEFRKLAAPLVAAWTIAPRSQRQPMPRAELQKHWDDFTRRVGFVHQRRKTRQRRWFLLMVAIAGAVFTELTSRDPAQAPKPATAEWVTVPDSGKEMTLYNGARVRLAPGARLLYSRADSAENRPSVALEGSARFILDLSISEQAPVPMPPQLAVMTAGALVISNAAEFVVTTRADTTDVEVIDRKFDVGKALGTGTSVILPEQLFVTNPDSTFRDQLVLSSGELGRGYRGGTPVKLREVKHTGFPAPDSLAMLLGGQQP
jgi:hypothetical protein